MHSGSLAQRSVQNLPPCYIALPGFADFGQLEVPVWELFSKSPPGLLRQVSTIVKLWVVIFHEWKQSPSVQVTGHLKFFANTKCNTTNLKLVESQALTRIGPEGPSAVVLLTCNSTTNQLCDWTNYVTSCCWRIIMVLVLYNNLKQMICRKVFKQLIGFDKQSLVTTFHWGSIFTMKFPSAKY